MLWCVDVINALVEAFEKNPGIAYSQPTVLDFVRSEIGRNIDFDRFHFILGKISANKRFLKRVLVICWGILEVW